MFCVFKILMFLTYYTKISKTLVFRNISTSKALDPITVLRTHINMAFAQILNYKNNIVSPTDKEIQAQWG